MRYLPVPVWRHITSYLYLSERQTLVISDKLSFAEITTTQINNYVGPLHSRNLSHGLHLLEHFRRHKKHIRITYVQLSSGEHLLPRSESLFLTGDPPRQLLLSKNIDIRGSPTAEKTILLGGLVVNTRTNVELHHLTVSNPYNIGLTIGKMSHCTLHHVDIQDCKRSGCKLLDGTSSLSAHKGSFSNNGENGIYCNGGRCTLTDCNVNNNTTSGLAVRSKGRIQMIETCPQAIEFHGNTKSISCWGRESIVDIQLQNQEHLREALAVGHFLHGIGETQDVQRGGVVQSGVV